MNWNKNTKQAAPDGTGNSVEKSMLYYTVGSVIYYVCQWMLSVVIVRISGYEAAGVLSIAMTVCAAPAIVSLFNVRAYQVSDLKGEYVTKTYIKSRHYTNLLAYLVCIGMIFAGGYNLEKTLVILVFMLYKLAEGVSDVYYGIEQKHNRLDIAGISYTLRGIGTIAPFIVFQIIWDNLLVSLTAITICSYGVVFIYDVPKCRKLERKLKLEKTSFAEIKSLLFTCVPLAVVAFLNNLSVNLPKIALENYFGSTIMGFFSSVTSPSTVVQLVAVTLFAPLVTPLTEAFQKKEKEKFFAILRKFMWLLLAFAVLCVAGAAVLGKFVLILIFGSGIEPYVYLFIPSILMMMLVAVNASLFSVCTLVREIKLQYLIGFAGIAASGILAITVVKEYSMMGVIYAQIGTILIQTLIQIVIIGRRLRKTW